MLNPAAAAILRTMSSSSAGAAGAAHKFIEIGANLLDGQFRGKYHGKRAHANDSDLLFYRAEQMGMTHCMVTCSNLKDSRRGLEMCAAFNKEQEERGSKMRLFSTVGVHPTQSKQLEFGAKAGEGGKPESESEWSDKEGAAPASQAAHHHFDVKRGTPRSKAEYIAGLEHCIEEGKKSGIVVAIGECGLDYDRLFFSPQDVQLRHFELHFDLAEKYQLPLFLHDRNTGGEFLEIVKKHRHRIPGGVVHSFTGTAEEARAYLELGLMIGINGCSLKTEDNCNVVKTLPIEKILLETDAPWCEIKKSHFSHQFVTTHFNSVKKEKYDPSMLREYCDMKRARGEMPPAAAAEPVGAGAAPAAGAGAAATASGGKKAPAGKKGGAGGAAACAAPAKPLADESAFTLVNGRSEPCQIVQVAEVVAALKGVTVEALASQVYRNTVELFFPGEKDKLLG